MAGVNIRRGSRWWNGKQAEGRRSLSHTLQTPVSLIWGLFSLVSHVELLIGYGVEFEHMRLRQAFIGALEEGKDHMQLHDWVSVLQIP